MSTAIMHQSALYDFGELFMKNQGVCSEQSQHSALARARSLGAAAGAGAGPQGAPPACSLRQALVRASALLQHRRLERAASEPAQLQPQQQQQQQPPNASRYKTELCRPFEEAGSCKYGDKCQFAHGMRELRNLQRHPKYKTELCRTYHSVGFCPYGPRCHFVHNADEARARPSLPPSPGSTLSRSPADSVSSFFPCSPPLSPRTSPPPSPEEARLPVFNRLSSTILAFGDMALA